MKIAFIGMNLIHGGGKTVGMKITEKWLMLHPKEKLYALLPNDNEYRKIWRENGGNESNVWWFDKVDASRNGRLKLELNGDIRRWLKKNRIDRVFNATNLPIISSPCKQTLFLHRAFLVAPINMYNEYFSTSKKANIYFEKKVFSILKCHVDNWVVQTKFMKRSLMKSLSIPANKIEVIFSGADLGENKFEKEVFNEMNSKESLKSTFDIFCPTKNYDHKRIETIIDILENINSEVKIRFLVTLKETDAKDKELLTKLIENIKKGNVLNLGYLTLEEMVENYKLANAFYMPSLLESFGLPFVEAMHFSLPVLTFKKEFAGEICGDAAFYFCEKEIVSVVAEIEELVRNKEYYKKRCEDSYIRGQKISITWFESTQLLYESVIKS